MAEYQDKCVDCDRDGLWDENVRLRGQVDKDAVTLANIGEQLACDEPWKTFNKTLGTFALTPQQAAEEFRRMRGVIAKPGKLLHIWERLSQERCDNGFEGQWARVDTLLCLWDFHAAFKEAMKENDGG